MCGLRPCCSQAMMSEPPKVEDVRGVGVLSASMRAVYGREGGATSRLKPYVAAQGFPRQTPVEDGICFKKCSGSMVFVPRPMTI